MTRHPRPRCSLPRKRLFRSASRGGQIFCPTRSVFNCLDRWRRRSHGQFGRHPHGGQSGEAFGFGKAIRACRTKRSSQPPTNRSQRTSSIRRDRSDSLLRWEGSSRVPSRNLPYNSCRSTEPGSLLTMTIDAGVWSAGSSTCEWTSETMRLEPEGYGERLIDLPGGECSAIAGGY